MKRFALPALTLGLATLLIGGAYQARQAGGVAVVHVDVVLASIPKYVENDSILARERQIFVTELRTLQANLDRAVAEFNQKAIGLSPTAQQAQRQALQAQADSNDLKMAEYDKRLGERQQALLRPIEDKVTSIIEGLRAEGGYAIVLNVGSPNSAVLAIDKGVDLTAKVIERAK